MIADSIPPERRARPAAWPLALEIPIDPDRACTLIRLVGNQIGVQDQHFPGTVPWWPDLAEGQAYCWWGRPPEPAAGGGPQRSATPVTNPRAFGLAAQLGCPDLADRLGLHGDVLVTGLTPNHASADVPVPVLAAARRTGLLPALPQRTRQLDRPSPWHSTGTEG